MKTARVFRRHRLAPYPPSRPRCLRKPGRPSCVGHAFARGVLPGAFVRGLDLSTRVSMSSANPKTHKYMSCMHDLAINKEHHGTTACCSCPPKTTHFFARCRLTGVYRIWFFRTENDAQYFSGPGSCYRYHPPNTFRSRRHHDTTVCCGSVPKGPFISLGADWLALFIQTLVLPNRK